MHDFICHFKGLIRVWLEAPGFHLIHNTLDNVPVFQGQEWDEEVHKATLYQTGMPQSTCSKLMTDVNDINDVNEINDVNDDYYMTVRQSTLSAFMYVHRLSS